MCAACKHGARDQAVDSADGKTSFSSEAIREPGQCERSKNTAGLENAVGRCEKLRSIRSSCEFEIFEEGWLACGTSSSVSNARSSHRY